MLENTLFKAEEKTDKELTTEINKTFETPPTRHHLKEAYLELMDLIDAHNEDTDRRQLQNRVVERARKQKLSFKKALLLETNKAFREYKKNIFLIDYYYYEYKKSNAKINSLSDYFITVECIQRIAFYNFCRIAQNFNKTEFGAKTILQDREIEKAVNQLLYNLDIIPYKTEFKITSEFNTIHYKKKFYRYFK